MRGDWHEPGRACMFVVAVRGCTVYNPLEHRVTHAFLPEAKVIFL